MNIKQTTKEIKYADFKGKLEYKFNWRKLRFDFGRKCYTTNAAGNTEEEWWEWCYSKDYSIISLGERMPKIGQKVFLYDGFNSNDGTKRVGNLVLTPEYGCGYVWIVGDLYYEFKYFTHWQEAIEGDKV